MILLAILTPIELLCQYRLLKPIVRILTPPKLSKKELAEAVRLEAEQYIPVPLSELYLDYDQISTDDENNEYFLVAISKPIVDSYMGFAEILGLEVAVIENIYERLLAD